MPILFKVPIKETAKEYKVTKLIKKGINKNYLINLLERKKKET